MIKNKILKKILMTLLLCAMIGVTVIQPSFSSALGTGPANIVDLLKTNDYKAETVQVFDGGKLCKVLAGDNAVYNVIFYNDGSTELYDPVKHEKIFQKDKISPALKSKIEKAKDDEKIPVSIWIKDIDYNKVNSFVKDKINIDAADIEKDNLKLDKMQEYIETKRSKAKDEYNNNNSRFVKRALASDTILFTSKYAPLVIAELNKKEIEMLRNSDDVFDMDFFVNECNSTDETAFSIPNINANYTRDTLGLKGSGVKIGQIESGYPNKTNAQLSDRSITFDVPDNQANITDHATEVSSIIVGKTNGLVPNAALYVASNYTSTTNFYEKIEWLITQGVNVINMSNTTGGTAGAYTSIAKWIDHLAIQHSVHFVKSAGNSGPSGGITEPGMAYNIMTVGSINDHDSPNEPNWSDDTFSTYSSYVEDSSAAYKPDVTAPGEGITAGGLTGSGTSFSTPHVTGVIAQLINAYSTLATKQTAMKAILAGGTKHKTADDYGNNSLSPNYSNKEGAGVVDAKSSYYIAANTRYLSLQLYNSSFPYEKTFTVTSSDTLIRVSLAWLKRNSVSSPHSTGTITEKPLSDLDLEVYDPNGNLVGRSISGVNNVELVQFVPQMTGTYKIKVIGYSLKNDYEFIGLAWF